MNGTLEKSVSKAEHQGHDEHSGAFKILRKKPTKWESFLAGELPAGCPPCACLSMMFALWCSAMMGYEMFKLSTVFGFFVLSNPNTAAFLADLQVRDTRYFSDEEGVIRAPVMIGYRSRPINLINICMEAKNTKCPGEGCDLTSQNLLQLDKLKLLQELETDIWNSEIYQTHMCAIKDANNTRCTAPNSLLQLLLWEGDAVVESSKNLVAEGYGDNWWDCERWVSPADKIEYGSCWSQWWSYTNKSLGAGKLKDWSEYSPILERLCTEGDAFWMKRREVWFPRFACKDDYLKNHGTPFLLSNIPVGIPWDKDREIQDIDWGQQFADMKEKFGLDLFDVIKKSTDKILSNRDDVNLVTGGAVVNDADENAQLMSSLRNGAISVGLVFLYMWFTVESFFLGFMAMMQVVGAVFPAMVMWTVMNPSGIQFLQFIAVFLVLGIGADDIFVFNDAYKQSKLELSNQPNSKPIYIFMLAYRRAFSAMLATTCTSSLAMFFGSLNPIPAISNFCIFAGLLIVWDLLLTITFYSSIVIFQERYMDGQRYCCFGGTANPGGFCQRGCCFGLLRRCYRSILGIPHEQTTSQRKLEVFFAGPFLDAITRMRYFLIAFWIVVFIITTTSAIMFVKVTEKDPEGLAPDHPKQRCATIQGEYFATGSPQKVHITFGLDPEEPVAKWNKTEAERVEEPRFSDIAGATSKYGQQKILDLCQAVSANAGTTRCFDKDKCIVRGTPSQCEFHVVNGYTVPKEADCNSGRYCIMEQVKEYATNNGLEFPVENLFEIVSSTGFRDYLRNMFTMYEEIQRDYEIDNFKQGTGFIFEDGNIKYMWLGFNATFEEMFMPPKEGTKIFDDWKQFIDGHLDGIDHHVLTVMFIFKTMQDMLVQEAVKSVGYSLAVALVTLCAVTWNWQVSLMGLLNLVFIVSFFLGCWPLLGWELDIFNVIFTIMAVGLSVDYTVHLLHAYNASTRETRSLRCKDALSEMGITVLSGAVTTLLAPIPLINDQTVFFQRFARFIFLIIGTSIIMALLNLVPWLLVAGPAQGQGDIAPFYWIAKICSGASDLGTPAGNGTAGNGTAGNGTTGNGTAGHGIAGNGTAGIGKVEESQGKMMPLSNPSDTGNGQEHTFKIKYPEGSTVMQV